MNFWGVLWNYVIPGFLIILIFFLGLLSILAMLELMTGGKHDKE